MNDVIARCWDCAMTIEPEWALNHATLNPGHAVIVGDRITIKGVLEG